MQACSEAEMEMGLFPCWAWQGGKEKCNTARLTIRTQPTYCLLHGCWISSYSSARTKPKKKGSRNIRHMTQILLYWKQGRHIMKSSPVYKVILLIRGIHLILRSTSRHAGLRINLCRFLSTTLSPGSECKWGKPPQGGHWYLATSEYVI